MKLVKSMDFILPGDLSFNMLNGPKCERMKGVCDIFDLSNIVKDPTCVTSRKKLSLLDIILVNHASFIGKTFNFNCGLGDVHNLIGFQLNIDVPSNKPNWRNYGSFKKMMLKVSILNWVVNWLRYILLRVGMLMKCMTRPSSAVRPVRLCPDHFFCPKYRTTFLVKYVFAGPFSHVSSRPSLMIYFSMIKD